MPITSQHVIKWVDEAIRRALPDYASDSLPTNPVVTVSGNGLEGLKISVLDDSGDVAARFCVGITVVQETTHKPEWLNGLWGDVQAGDTTQGADGKEWLVVSNTYHLNGGDLLDTTVRNGEQSFTFTPAICQPVTFRRATPRESAQEGDSLIQCD